MQQPSSRAPSPSPLRSNQHFRSHSQPIIAQEQSLRMLHLQQQQQGLEAHSIEHPGDLIIDSTWVPEASSSTSHHYFPSSSSTTSENSSHVTQHHQQQHHNHSFEMSRFLDFAVDASVLLETLHQNGLIHGQLSQTSFYWEESSSLKQSGESNTSSNTSNNHSHSFSTSLPSDIDLESSSSFSNSVTGLMSTSPKNNYQGHPSRRENHTSPGQLTLDKSCSFAKAYNNCNSSNNNNNSKSGRRQRRYSLVLDCAHLNLGEKITEPMDSPARKGLRDHSQSVYSSQMFVPGTTQLNTPGPIISTDSNSNNSALFDPALFSPSDPNLPPYSTNSAAIIHDAIAARMARFKRTFLPSASSPAIIHPFTNPVSLPSSPPQTSPLSSALSGSTQSSAKQHFLLHIPQELHSPPGCVLPVQIDIYSLGVMFYYMWASYTALIPEECPVSSIDDGLTSFISGQGSTTAKGTYHPSTSARLANVIHKMVAKSSRDRFLSMIQVRKELTLIRDQELEAQKKEIETKVSSRSVQETQMDTSTSTMKTSQSLSALPSSLSFNPLARPSSPANSTHSHISGSTFISQELDAGSSTTRRSISSSSQNDGLSPEDRIFVLESVLSFAHTSNLQELLHAISQALDSILVCHPPEEMAIILWQKDDNLPNGGTWAIMEDKFQPGTTQSTLTWTDLSDRRDHMPVLVQKALDTQEPIFSTAVGSRSQLPTIACVPIMETKSTENPTLVGAIYLHHLHPRFYFTKRDQEILMLFCQKISTPLLHCEKIEGLEKQLSLVTQRNRFIQDTLDRIQKNEHEVFSWMEALPCFVWAAEHDDAASRRYLSRSWFDFTGLPADTRTSDRWISAMHPDDVAAFQKEVTQSYKTGVYKDCEFRLMRYDGVYRWHLSRAVPVLNHNGSILKWVGVTIDIDDLYLAQKAELHKKSNFLANMSHELRTPFSGFHGMLSLLSYSNLDEEQQECVHTAKSSCEKLLLIIDDLLDFSKLEAEKFTLENSPFDIEEVFEEVEDIVQPLAAQKQLQLDFIMGEDVPDILVGDCNRLKQILLNLAGNAIKFTHTGHVKVRCEVLERDSEMFGVSEDSSSAANVMDADKFYFKHEKNGGGQCQSEMRPPNSGRFSSPEPLSENSVKLMFSVEDTGIGISPEEQEVLFSPFSQVDGSATRSYGGSGLGLSICLQLVKLMKGRIGLTSERDKGSTFWFMIQCERSTASDMLMRPGSEGDVVDSTKEIKRITRTLGMPRILIASTSETTISSLQSYLSDFNTEVANLPTTAASRLEESAANGIRFDFVCWDFPLHDPNNLKILELQAQPSLNNIHFVVFYTPVPLITSTTSTDIIRRTQSLQHPSSSGLLASGRKRVALTQSASLRIDSNGVPISSNNRTNENSASNTGNLNGPRISSVSKPIRRIKLLRAFVQILDDSARIHEEHTVKKGSIGSSGAPGGAATNATPLSPTSTSTTAIITPISSPVMSNTTSATLSPVGMGRTPSASKMLSLDTALGNAGMTDSLDSTFYTATIGADQFNNDSNTNNNGPLRTPESMSNMPLEIVETEEVVTILDRSITPDQGSLPYVPKRRSTAPITATFRTENTGNNTLEKTKEEEKEEEKIVKKDCPAVSAKQKSAVNSSGKNSKLRSNSPKPLKASKLVTDEATELSLSHEEANRIEGMRILLAEDNLIAQKVLSKQLQLFGLVISCANDGADALALFKSHPRGYYALGFFDHHMPNCDGVQATQQIRALEKEHAAEIKGPVPRLPLVAVSADIQETARRACLNSGMERYVTKPLMQKDLVAIVRQYCVKGDAEASTLAYTPPPAGAEVLSTNMDPINVTSTVEAMVSAGHVMAPIGSGVPPHMLLSVSSSPNSGSVCVPVGLERSSVQKLAHPAPKREPELSPAQRRGLALLQDDGSKAGGGGTTKSVNMTIPGTPTGGSASLTHPMQHSTSHLGINNDSGHGLSRLNRGLHGQIIHKAVSSSSLYSSYQAGTISSPVLATSSTLSTPTQTAASSPIVGTPSSFASGLSGLNHSAHFPGPIAAITAGAAAAVAVASAAVNTVSSAIHGHIHQQSSGSNQNPNVNGGTHCPWTGVGSGGFNGSGNILIDSPIQKQQSVEQESSHIYHPPQEVFVPYLHPCEPSPTVEQTQEASLIRTVLPIATSAAIPISTPINAVGSESTPVNIRSAPLQLGSWM